MNAEKFSTRGKNKMNVLLPMKMTSVSCDIVSSFMCLLNGFNFLFVFSFEDCNFAPDVSVVCLDERCFLFPFFLAGL